MLKVGAGYVEATAGVRGLWGQAATPFARVEVGAHLRDNLSAFGYGQADLTGWQAGAGLRLVW